MKKWKVEIKGFAYVEANTAEEAERRFSDDYTVYKETDITSVEEVDEFRIET